MDGYDTILIPPENNLNEKEEKSVEIDVTNDEVNNIVKIQSLHLDPLQYPYRPIVKGSHYLVVTALFSFVLYSIIFTLPKHLEKNTNNPTKFLEPCNLSTVIPLAEIDSIKDEIQRITKEISAINIVSGYSISTLTNEHLTQKYANLSTASTNLKQKLQNQKQIRFACFKHNLEKRCEDEIESKKLKNIDIAIYVYLGIVVAFLTNSFYFLSKAKKIELSIAPKKAREDAMRCSKFFVQFHVITVLVWMYLPPLFICNIEKNLKKFPLI